MDAFPDLAAVMEGKKAPQELRRDSLLGSATMLRIFAGVYYDLVRAEPVAGELRMTDDEITAYLAKFEKHMAAPLYKKSPLFETGLFKESGMAPEASQGRRGAADQQVRRLGQGRAGVAGVTENPQTGKSRAAGRATAVVRPGVCSGDV